MEKDYEYKFLEHTSDVKFLASGISLEEAFTNSARALKETITEEDSPAIKPEEEKEIKVAGTTDLESLLYTFLEEFLYLLDAENFILSDFKSIEIDKEKLELKAKATGDKASNYNFTNDVKAITYNEMFVKNEKEEEEKEKTGEVWKCQVVLDV